MTGTIGIPKVAKSAVAAVCALVLFAAGSQAEAARKPKGSAAPTAPIAVQTLKLRDDVYMLSTAAGNVTLQLGDEGVVLAGAPGVVFSGAMESAVQAITGAPIRFVIDTSADWTQGGGAPVPNAYKRDDNNGQLLSQLGISTSTLRVIAQENVLSRMSAARTSNPNIVEMSVPSDAYFTAGVDFFFNGSPVEVIHLPAAHTDGDSAVFFRRSDVVSAGDVMDTTRYPVIDRGSGGSIAGVIAALNRILAIAVPAVPDEGGTLVVPGRGRVCDEIDVAEYRNMLVIIRDRIQELIRQGMTREQVYAAKPTLDYDGVYGVDQGSWTTRRFIDAVYADLKQ